jgi:hypothetical protein
MRATAKSSRLPAQCTGPVPFDYNSVSHSVSAFLRGQAQRIQRYAGKCIVTIGKDLISAKHYLSHGAFTRWVESEVGMSARTAQDYMKVAEWSADKGSIVSRLPPSLLYMLSRSSTPKAFTEAVLKRIEAGERVPLANVRGELRLLARRRTGAEMIARPDEQGVDDGLSGRDGDRREPLSEAVRIMARGLSASDFSRVRQLMTSKFLLSNVDLAARIVTAFSRTLEEASPEVRQIELVSQPESPAYVAHGE